MHSFLEHDNPDSFVEHRHGQSSLQPNLVQECQRGWLTGLPLVARLLNMMAPRSCQRMGTR